MSFQYTIYNALYMWFYLNTIDSKYTEGSERPRPKQVEKSVKDFQTLCKTLIQARKYF